MVGMYEIDTYLDRPTVYEGDTRQVGSVYTCLKFSAHNCMWLHSLTPIIGWIIYWVF